MNATGTGQEMFCEEKKWECCKIRNFLISSPIFLKGAVKEIFMMQKGLDPIDLFPSLHRIQSDSVTVKISAAG